MKNSKFELAGDCLSNPPRLAVSFASRPRRFAMIRSVSDARVPPDALFHGSTADGLATLRRALKPARPGGNDPYWHGKHRTRSSETDDKILSLHLRGFSPQSIQSRLKLAHDVGVPLSRIASVAQVPKEVREWQARPLDAIYPLVCLDCRQLWSGSSDLLHDTVCTAIGIKMTGEKEVLGFWLTRREDATFKRHILNDLRDRGVRDVLLVCAGGLTDFPEAISTVFPHTRVLPNIVKMVRHSLEVMPWKQRAEVAAGLKRIYRAASTVDAQRHMREFETRWGNDQLPTLQLWRHGWLQLAIFLDYPEHVRKIAVTACDAMETMLSGLHKLRKRQEGLTDGNSTAQMVYLVLSGTRRGWKRPVKHWKSALNHLMDRFGRRIPMA